MVNIKAISETLITELESLIGMCFVGNRMMDRIKSQLSVKFAMPKFSNYIHINMAHQMPLLADEIGDYLESRNHDEGYPDTPADFSDYRNPRECFDKILRYFLDLEIFIGTIIEKASQEKDFNVKSLLLDFIREINKFTEKALLFVDLSEKYGNDSKDNMRLDSNILEILEGD